MSEMLKRDAGLDLGEQVARLEDRVARLEELFAARGALTESNPISLEADPPALTDNGQEAQRTAEDLEYEVGQNWFAKVGIVALAAGAAFALSLPFEGLPAIIPSLGGWVVAAILFALSHRWGDSFELVARYFRGAAMALLFIAALRLYYFGKPPLLSLASPAGHTLLALIIAANLAIAYQRKSPYLIVLSLIMGYAAAVAVNAPSFVLIAVTALSAVAAHARIKRNMPWVLILGTALTSLGYLNWAANNPFFSRSYRLLPEHYPGVFVLLGCMAIFALGGILRKATEREDPPTIIGSALNCTLGYGVFLLHSLVLPTLFVTAHLLASIVLLGLAAVFWTRDRSEYSTFLYAMTGYMALSAALVKMSSAPEVFVLLSLQSLLVLTTAIWFQSRFIVVTNFLIYVGIGVAYLVVARQESGISFVLGVVALVSARILNWKKERLLLKTELMRNAYLISAFVIFPYSLYHLVPSAYLAVAWVGVALFYYGMNLIVRNPKYRWLGHATLLLTALYLFIAGISRFEPIFRILSFFVVGAALLIVSVVFTKVRRRDRGQ